MWQTVIILSQLLYSVVAYAPSTGSQAFGLRALDFSQLNKIPDLLSLLTLAKTYERHDSPGDIIFANLGQNCRCMKCAMDYN